MGSGKHFNLKSRRSRPFVESLESRTLCTAVPVDGTGTPIAVQPGQTVTISATITTANDPNENGEGESLRIQANNGVDIADSDFNVTNTYTFVAGAGTNPIYFYATIDNGDGDEDARVDVTASSSKNDKYTPEQKNEFNKLAARYAEAAAAAQATYVVLSKLPSPYAKAAALVAEATAATLAVISGDYWRRSADPPDSDYTHLAHNTPVNHSLLVSSKDFTGAKNAGPLAASLNQLSTRMQLLAANGNAQYITANRIDGATLANNAKWMKIQQNHLKALKRQEAALLSTQARVQAKAAAQLDKSGLGTQPVRSSDVKSFEQQLVDHGLPAAMVDTFTKLGVDADTQEQIRQLLFVQDASKATGTCSSFLTNPDLAAELKQTASLLRHG